MAWAECPAPFTHRCGISEGALLSGLWTTAKGEASDAVTRFKQDYDDTVEAFHRLEAAHRQGDLATELAEAFRTKARQVHIDVAATRIALADLRTTISTE